MRQLFCGGGLFVVLLSVSAQPYGLHVDAQGRLLYQGRPYRGFGVNWHDLFLRLLEEKDWQGYEEGFRQLAALHIPFVRFIACGFWPKQARLYLEDPAEFFRRFDLIVRCAEKYQIGLIPSLFWNVATPCDLVGEPCNRWGDPQSKTHSYMRQYVRDVVTRYNNSPAIWAWEFGNEFNLGANLPNASEHRPTIVPHWGTPATRSAEDEWTYEIIRTAFAEFGRCVRQYDLYRALSTGDSIVRPSAWHNWKERSWTRDTPEQQMEMILADNPEPIDLISVHIYEDSLAQLPYALEASRRTRKPLFVGEFGVPGPRDEKSEALFRSMLQALVEGGVPLAALWSFGGYAPHQQSYRVGLDNERAYQLYALKELNERFEAERRAQP